MTGLKTKPLKSGPKKRPEEGSSKDKGCLGAEELTMKLRSEQKLGVSL